MHRRPRCGEHPVGGEQPEISRDGLAGKDDLPAPGPHSVGEHHEVVALGSAVLERHVDTVGVLIAAHDPVAVAVLDVRSRRVDEDAREFAAEDLQLGRRASAVRRTGRERRDRRAPSIDEPGALFRRGRGEESVLQTHAAYDLAAGTTNVDVLPAEPRRRSALDDRHGTTRPREPVREGRAGDAGPGDQYASFHSHDLRLPCSLPVRYRKDFVDRRYVGRRATLRQGSR